jgi:hypothetical protein
LIPTVIKKGLCQLKAVIAELNAAIGGKYDKAAALAAEHMRGHTCGLFGWFFNARHVCQP